MSELLTTGQIIDRLKVGEVAESVEMASFDNFVYRVKKTESGSIMALDSNLKMTGHHIPMQGDIVNLKWRIQPNYVSFEKAMKALREGKKVELHIDGRSELYIEDYLDPDPINVFNLGDCTFKELIEGSWTIEGESQ